jgi:hypothetical protein
MEMMLTSSAFRNTPPNPDAPGPGGVQVYSEAAGRAQQLGGLIEPIGGSIEAAIHPRSG